MVIAELIERFDRYQNTYKSHQYNQRQVRQEFVDLFFKALGWDLDNAQSSAEASRGSTFMEGMPI
jgi:predicted type IV restriction endonuclease